MNQLKVSARGETETPVGIWSCLFSEVTMNTPASNVLEFNVCNPDRNGRILKSDQRGRSFIAGFRPNVIPFRPPQGVRQVSALSELKVGDAAVLVSLDLPESVQNHLMHMGFVPDAQVTVLRRAPAGDPTVYGIDGMEIALRHETAEAIRVRKQSGASEHQSGLAVAAAGGTTQLREAAR
jgi:Fe2+ transport system protein FeoA